MNKLILLSLIFLMSLSALGEQFPPTTSQDSADTSGVTTFNYQFPNFTGTHTATTFSLGVNSVAGGGTGSTSFTLGSIPFSNGTILTQDNAKLFWNDTNPGLGIGTATPAASAIVDMVSTTQGMRMPGMTDTQMNAVATPATGLQIYNTSEGVHYWYNGTVWVNPRRLIAITFVTTGTTFTTSAGVTAIHAILVGGGGGGGGCTSAATGDGGAGGGGGYAATVDTGLIAVTQSTAYTIAIGAAGAAGAAGNNAGGTGGSTTLTVGATTYTAAGGTGGAGGLSTAGNTGAAGGNGGAGTNGLFNLTGTWGGFSTVTGNTYVVSGGGASGNFGSGGKPISPTAGGATGSGYGSGGSGGACINATNQAGGVGTAGAMMIEQYS